MRNFSCTVFLCMGGCEVLCMGNYALLHCIGVWRKSPIEALSFLFTSLPILSSHPLHIPPSLPASPLSASPLSPLTVPPPPPPTPNTSHPSLPHLFILSFSLYRLVCPLLFLRGDWGKQGQEAAWLSDNGTHQNQKSSTNLTNFSHTHKHSKTNRTFQLPAAPDSSPWLI